MPKVHTSSSGVTKYEDHKVKIKFKPTKTSDKKIIDGVLTQKFKKEHGTITITIKDRKIVAISGKGSKKFMEEFEHKYPEIKKAYEKHVKKYLL